MIKVVSVANMQKSDAHTIETKISSTELMARAGNAIFSSVEWREPVAIVCGSGNNAGDGFVVASLLTKASVKCEIFLLSEKFSSDGKHFYDECSALKIPTHRGIDELKLDGFQTVLDCLLGTGFKGEISEPYKTAIERINQSDAYIVSADINSGLGGDSGLFDTCVRSDITVSIGMYKSGLFLNAAKDVIKHKINCDIGIEPVETPAYLIERSDIRHLFPKRKNFSNKGDYGYVALIGGSLEYSGAVKLSNLSLSALRSGAGVAKLAVPKNIAHAVLPYLLESTLFLLDDEDGAYHFNENTAKRLINNTAVVALGMGMGRSEEVGKLISYLLSNYSGKLIIDADGLNMLSQLDKAQIKNAACKLVLTPHLKEFERLSGEKIEDFRDKLIEAAKRYASDMGVILLLKGPTTVITDGSTVYLVDKGCAGMATAGSGDVLSGILAGIIPSSADDSLLLAVAAGAYVNGLAGELAALETPEISMLAGDTTRAIPNAIKAITE